MYVAEFESERDNVGPGWQSLIEQVHKDLSAVAPGYQILQIKEKFGGLRYYVALPNTITEAQSNAAHSIVSIAESASLTLCEECGTKDDVSNAGPGWIRTLCPECREEWKAKRAERLNG